MYLLLICPVVATQTSVALGTEGTSFCLTPMTDGCAVPGLDFGIMIVFVVVVVSIVAAVIIPLLQMSTSGLG